MLFAVLPWGVRREENPEPGHDPGAPAKTHLWAKVIATTDLVGPGLARGLVADNLALDHLPALSGSS